MNNWEKAANAIDKQNQTESDPDGDEMRARQRKMIFDDWNSVLAKSAEQGSVPDIVEEALPDSGWMDNYKNNYEVTQTESPISINTEVLDLLKEHGKYYPSMGLINSIKILLTELESTKTQLNAIKKIAQR